MKGHLRTLVLAAVAGGEPLHGYALITSLLDRTDGLFAFNEGAIYPILHQLESEGVVRSTWDASTGRRRRTYRLTAKGRKVLAAEASDWWAFRDGVDAVLKEVPWLSSK